MDAFSNKSVESVFKNYPSQIHQKMMDLRQRIEALYRAGTNLSPR